MLMKHRLYILLTLTLLISQAAAADRLAEALKQDPPPIDIATGHVIPDEGYCDQPYVVKLPYGTWLCTMTTGKGHEGNRGQHIVSTRSKDHGKTWSKLVDIEPADGPEASWVMPYLTDYGRVYVFYTYNARDLREIKADTNYARKRVDTQGDRGGAVDRGVAPQIGLGAEIALRFDGKELIDALHRSDCARHCREDPAEDLQRQHQHP